MKSIRMIGCLVWLTTLSGLCRLDAQSLLADQAFFVQTGKNEYQEWLNDSGIGQVIKVRSVEVSEDQVILFLAFYAEDLNYCIAAWRQLKKDFAAKKAISLEQALFYKMIVMMDVPQEQAIIRIYSTLEDQDYYFGGIHFEKGQVRVLDQLNSRSETRFVEVSPTNLDSLKGEAKARFYKKYDKAKIFNLVLNYAKDKYPNICGEKGGGEIQVLEKGVVLRFRVDDLCREILKSSRNPWYCRFFNCNYIKRERITFLVTYSKMERGVQIGVEVDGRYSSGYYKEVGRKGYHLMDDNFKEDLEEYADIVKLEIEAAINQAQ